MIVESCVFALIYMYIYVYIYILYIHMYYLFKEVIKTDRHHDVYSNISNIDLFEILFRYWMSNSYFQTFIKFRLKRLFKIYSNRFPRRVQK